MGRGGVAFDLHSGAYFALNETAAFICDRLLDPAEPDVPRQVAARFGLPPADAATAVAQVLGQLSSPAGPAPALPSDEFPYRRVRNRYVLFHRQTPLLSVDATGSEAHLCPEAHDTGFTPSYLLRLSSPKILQANGIGVLHAAAFKVHDGLMVVSGRSGAGKSTTSRHLGEALGAPAFADDLVVVGEGPQAGCARPGAEAAIYAFCDRAGPQMTTDQPLALAGLVAAATAAPADVPVDQLLLVARERRQGTAVVAAPLDPADALLEILNTVFLGAAEASAIRRYLVTCRDLALAVPMARLFVPDGLPALAQAARAWADAHTSKTTSKP